MRIAQVSPLHESVPPQGYGGTERVVGWLTEELVRRGHRVTLFASGDSKTSAELVGICERSLRNDGRCSDPTAYHVLMVELLRQRAREFDIIHFHLDHIHYPLARTLGIPHVTTQHGRLDCYELQALYDEFGDMPLVSISDAQRAPLPQATFVSTVYHGMPLDQLEWRSEPGQYFAFLGRISPEKRLDRAIAIAKRLRKPLRVAAKVSAADEPYFEQTIKPLLNDPLIEFVGEVGEGGKSGFLSNACALLFPIDWPEPFGLVMIESMACGTPVIAFRCGSVPEIIDDGVTGFIVDDMEAAVDAARRACDLDRSVCRATCERRFAVARMAEDYLRVYAQLIEREHREPSTNLRNVAAA